MKTNYEVKHGTGPQVVQLVCGAQVVVSATGPAQVLVKDIPQRAVFRLPDDVDSVEVVAPDFVSWTLRFASCRPRAEIPDPTPVAIPVGGYKPESLEQTIARMVRSRVNELAVEAGFDPESEEDFDDDENDDITTPFEYEKVAQEAAKAQAARKYVAKKRQQAREAAQRKKTAAQQPPAEQAVQQGAPAAGSEGAVKS